MSLLLPHFFCEFAFTFWKNHPFPRETFWKNRNATKTLKYRHVPFLEGCFTDSTLITKEFDSQFLGRGVGQHQLFTVTFYLNLALLLEGSKIQLLLLLSWRYLFVVVCCSFFVVSGPLDLLACHIWRQPWWHHVACYVKFNWRF